MSGNAYYFTGFAKNTAMRMGLSMREGAPLMEGTECVLEDGTAVYNVEKWWHRRCRFFARQKERSVISVTRRTAEHPTLDERFLITGLRDATLVFRPPVGARVRVANAKDGRGMLAYRLVPTETAGDGRTVTAEHLTGDYYVAWQSDHNPGCMLGENQMHPPKVTKTRR